MKYYFVNCWISDWFGFLDSNLSQAFSTEVRQSLWL